MNKNLLKYFLKIILDNSALSNHIHFLINRFWKILNSVTISCASHALSLTEAYQHILYSSVTSLTITYSVTYIR